MKSEKSKDRTALLILLSITLIFRLWTVMMIHTGVDERDYWYSAKALTQTGVSYPEINHRTIRWGVIIPVAAQQLITGASANAYYVMPILNSLLQTFLIFFLGKRLRGRAVGFMSALMLVFFPYQIRSASQVRPEIFSITYILLVLFFIYRYLENRSNRENTLNLLLAAFFMYIAYLTKITNLFFMPAIFILIRLYRPQNWLRDSLLFGLLPLAFFLLETLIYRVSGPWPFGQLSIIMSNHVADMETITSFWGVFGRYSLNNLQLYWQLPLWSFVGIALWTLRFNRRKELVILIVPVFSFLFFITFTLSGLHPLKMAEPFVNRYFSAVLPMIFLLLSWYFDRLLATKEWYLKIAHKMPLLATGALLCFMVITSLPLFPQQLKAYIHSPVDHKNHPFYQNIAYTKAVNLAWKVGIPLISVEGNAGSNALFTASWFYLDRMYYTDGHPPAPLSIADDTTLAMLSLGGRSCAGVEEVIALVRNPFRMKVVAVTELAELQSERFPE